METLLIRRSAELAPEDLRALRSIFVAVWGECFTEDDWGHMFPGVHFILEVDGRVVSHGSVVDREIHAGDHELRTGYVENVATRPDAQSRGYGTAVMRAVSDHIEGAYELGGLGTGRPEFYERLGWRLWRGPTYVRAERGLVRTAEEDGYVMVLLTPSSPEIDLDAAISCDWRPGDVW